MARTFLTISVGDLGDTIVTVPAMRALRERYPEARIVLLAKAGPGDFVRRLHLVDDVIAIDKHGFDRLAGLVRPGRLLAVMRLLRRLRSERIDTVVIFHHLVTRFGTLKYASLALASGATCSVGLDNGRGWFLTHSARDEGFGAMHEGEYWLRVAQLLDARGSLVPGAPISDVDRAAAAQLLTHLPPGGGPIVAVHPGTGPYAPGRKWGADRYGATMTELHVRHGARFVLVGTQADRSDVAATIAATNAPFLDIVGRTNVGELAAVLQRCDLVLANDGGVGHLAAAAGTAVVSVFGPSNERAWRPIGSRVVAADLPCRPCLYRDFETGLRNGCGPRQCLELVRPEQVVDAVNDILTSTNLR